MSELKEPEQELILFSVEEAARMLKISPKTLEKYRCMGGGPKYIRIGRRVLYSTVELQVWLRARSFSCTSEYSEL